MLQAIAGYDAEETTGQKIEVPQYSSALRAKTSSFRLGKPRDFFFEGLHPEIEAAIHKALSLLGKTYRWGSGDQIPVSTNRSVTDAEAYAYHAESLAKTPELYQPYTRARLRAGADVTALAYIQGRRELAQLRQDVRKVFASVDALVTPTAPIPPRTILEASADDPWGLAARPPQHGAIQHQWLAHYFDSLWLHECRLAHRPANQRPAWGRDGCSPTCPCLRAGD